MSKGDQWWLVFRGFMIGMGVAVAVAGYTLFGLIQIAVVAWLAWTEIEDRHTEKEG